MKVLGLESSGKVAGVALIEDGEVLAEYFLNIGITHSQTFLPMIDQLLSLSSCTLADIDLLAVSEGPGSYTGLRIGIATAKGFALSKQIPVIGISTLEALAHEVADFQGKIYSVLFARSDELYVAVYQSQRDGLHSLEAPKVLHLPDVLDKIRKEEGEMTIIGDGFWHFEKEFRDIFHNSTWIASKTKHQLFARNIALLGEKKAAEAISGKELVPVYLKKTQAERECE